MNKPVATVEDITKALEEHRGNISAAARALRISRMTIYRRIEEDKTLVDVIESAKETKIDNVESKLYSKAVAGDTTCMIFFLKTKGRKRGYGDQLNTINIDMSKLTNTQLSRIANGEGILDVLTTSGKS